MAAWPGGWFSAPSTIIISHHHNHCHEPSPTRHRSHRYHRVRLQSFDSPAYCTVNIGHSCNQELEPHRCLRRPSLVHLKGEFSAHQRQPALPKPPIYRARRTLPKRECGQPALPDPQALQHTEKKTKKTPTLEFHDRLFPPPSCFHQKKNKPDSTKCITGRVSRRQISQRAERARFWVPKWEGSDGGSAGSSAGPKYSHRESGAPRPLPRGPLPPASSSSAV
ncbi:hypothetical protein FN846DRAFT_581969 [Sphaerosporella brunnea]|uniref:Uncharacterized protein n=1 Tax=Sphaerosporella brunnea TaxID=1250544 RepID=A0A5J5F203_9PEZI|nr:hypothetical protein FN846DRAFT_581969 [Sphaerosporella brunnea]